tara:strand:- start:1260 stop:1424 length:165 start_codon:yes stop_codon:yes gene_type:complete
LGLFYWALENDENDDLGAQLSSGAAIEYVRESHQDGQWNAIFCTRVQHLSCGFL